MIVSTPSTHELSDSAERVSVALIVVVVPDAISPLV